MTPMKTIPAALWLASGLCSASAWAQGDGASGSASQAAATAASAPVQGRLTRAQLAECLKRQADLGTQKQALQGTNATLQTERSQLQSEYDAQAAALTKLDKSDQDAVDAYNEKGNAVQAKAKDWNARNSKLANDVQALQAEQKAWNVDCGNKSFLDEDAQAVQPAK